MTNDETYVVFQSAATAGIVYVELGFIPSKVRLTVDLFGAAKEVLWMNNAQFPLWPIANTVVSAGASAATVADTTTAIAIYAGGDTITSNETAATAGKHVDRKGNPATQGHITAPGIAITAAMQVNSGFCLVEASRNDQ